MRKIRFFEKEEIPELLEDVYNFITEYKCDIDDALDMYLEEMGDEFIVECKDTYYFIDNIYQFNKFLHERKFFEMYNIKSFDDDLQ